MLRTMSKKLEWFETRSKSFQLLLFICDTLSKTKKKQQMVRSLFNAWTMKSRQKTIMFNSVSSSYYS